MTYQKTVGALCTADYKGPNRQYVVQDKLVLQEREREMGAVENTPYQNVVGSLCAADGPKGVTGQSVGEDKLVVGREVSHSIVRRLTPTECERLQGYPDGWVSNLPDKETMTDEEVTFWNAARKTECEIEGKTFREMNREQTLRWYNKMIHSESAQYKALGNSIATGPNSFWKFLIKRISAQYTRDITMGSLFDGIGGFPMVHEQINGKGTCLWASEVATFPIAVTQYHFNEE